MLWGSGFLLIKIALEGMSPIQIVLGRLLTAAVVMLVVVAYRKERLPRHLTPWAHLTVMAVVTNIAPYFLFAWGEQHISSSLGTYTERLTMPRLGGLLMGFLGVVVLAAPWHDAGIGSSLLGVGAALLASACYAASYVYARRFLSGGELSPVVLSTGQIVAGAILLGILAPGIVFHPMTLTTSVIVSVVVLGVLGTGVAYVLNYRLIADEGATAASTVTYLLPIVAVLLGLVVLAEPVGWNLVVGAVVVLVGVALSEGRLGRGQQLRASQQQAELALMFHEGRPRGDDDPG